MAAKVKNEVNIMMNTLPSTYFGPESSYEEKRKMVQKAFFPKKSSNYVPPPPLSNAEKRANYWKSYQQNKSSGAFNTVNNYVGINENLVNKTQNNKKAANKKAANNKARNNLLRTQRIKNKYGPKFHQPKPVANSRSHKTASLANNIFPSYASSVGNASTLNNNFNNNNNSSNNNNNNNNNKLSFKSSRPVYVPRPLTRKRR